MVNVPVVDGVRISVSRHNDSKVQKIGAQGAAHLQDRVCGWK